MIGHCIEGIYGQLYLGYDDIANHFYDHDETDSIYCGTREEWLSYWRNHGNTNPEKKFKSLLGDVLFITDHFCKEDCPFKTSDIWY